MILIDFWWQFLLVAISAYLLGSINFAIIFSKLFKHQDIRQSGSGNAGTTNVFRVFGLSMGALTFFCDTVKGVVACLVAMLIFSSFAEVDVVTVACYIAGVFVVLGHIFTVFYRFRGGKGFATTIGIMFFYHWLLMLIVLGCLVIVVIVTDRMSVAAISTVVFYVAWYWLTQLAVLGVIVCVCVSIVSCAVLYAHRSNILRLIQGKELPTGVRKYIFRSHKAQ